MDWAAIVGWLDAPHAELARQVLQRGTAAIFAVAFLSTLLQFPALLGERGLSPAPRYIAAGALEGQPNIFRWHYSDRFLRILCVVCIAIALALVAGLPQLGPPWLPMVAFLALWIVYLSILPIGQVFYGFGWELLLCEAGFLVAFLGSDAVAPPTLTLLLIVWLVFRLEFGAGMIKLRGGREWRDLTALMYHHETQPMPNPLSRWAHLAPAWWHKVEVLGNQCQNLSYPVPAKTLSTESRYQALEDFQFFGYGLTLLHQAFNTFNGFLNTGFLLDVSPDLFYLLSQHSLLPSAFLQAGLPLLQFYLGFAWVTLGQPLEFLFLFGILLGPHNPIVESSVLLIQDILFSL